MRRLAIRRSVLLLGYAVTGALHSEVHALNGLHLEEVVVTARRREERLQDVPISMTVFNQNDMRNANIVNAADLATYTPSLDANSRFGADSTTFAIRGFSQELRTTASVGVYFAEVVAPRGANSSQTGDGAGPGDFFDLDSVQVLKGPQGTLFGRNTTGGAVLLSPVKPTDELEGYLELSAGNYDMRRAQGVINIPLSDNFKLRFGLDHQKRDGYLNNISGVGPDDFSDLEYTSVRLSALWDITDRLQNYTIVKGTKSENNGTVGSLFACNPAAGGLAGLCVADLQSRIAAGNNGFYDVYSFFPDPVSEIEQWQVINTTTWTVNDRLAVKGILSYADYETWQRTSLNGTNWRIPTGGGMRHLVFAAQGLSDAMPSTDQETFVAELQFQGQAFDDRLVWQAGLYHEKSEPGGEYGPQSPAFIACDYSTITSADPADWRCNNLIGLGVVYTERGGVTYRNQAVYAEGSLALSSVLSLTAGVRYTKDETDATVIDAISYFPTDFVTGGFSAPNASFTEVRRPSASSEEPTWLVGLEYSPLEDLMLYGKYARGYRQGSVNSAGSAGLDVHGPEKVDTYELGLKSSFEGAVPGVLNVALFYNDFSDQQIQYGYFKPTGVGTTAILNAGESTIWGVEVETTLHLTQNFSITGSYTYLDTEVEKLQFPDLSNAPVNLAALNTSTAEGEPLSFSPKNKLLLSATYHLPLDPALGDMSIGATYVFTDKRQAVASFVSALAELPSYEVVNLNFNWNGIAGSPFDMALFATNVFDEEYRTFVSGNWNNGWELGRVGEPRMYGMRVRYNF